MPEHSINEAFLYPVFIMPLDFSKFRVKRDWSHGLRCHKEDPPECWVGKGRTEGSRKKDGVSKNPGESRLAWCVSLGEGHRPRVIVLPSPKP